jgi:hypothetical protein
VLTDVLTLFAAAVSAVPMPPGTYTNEEETYFDNEAKRSPAPWVGIAVDASGKIAFVDGFGKPVAPVAYTALAPADKVGRVRMTLSDGRITELRLARTATCWGAAPKATKKPDGSDDWMRASALRLHDQGGRVAFGGGTTGAPEVIVRMRNVIWPSGPSRPSLVLYVHKPGSPDRAEAYSWADPGAKRVGINLRWMQASCTIDGTE